MELLAVDYVILVVGVVMALTGLFCGFSGLLGFALAAAVAGLSASFAWGLSATYFGSPWQRALAVLIAVVLVFWLVRVLVRRTLHCALAQPGDAVLGALLGLVLVVVGLAIWALSGLGVEMSVLATQVAGFLPKGG